ncbi:MAG: L-fucokinase, partial [bacterium]
MPHAGRPSFDWLVLTAANARQAAAYEGQLRERFGGDESVRGGDRVGRAFAIADARDARIGSGAATVLALAEVARRVLRTRRARSLSEVFAGERVLILHSGGDSRRLPMYAVEGKIFAPIPRSVGGGACASVLDLLIDDLSSLTPRAGGEVLIGAGDAVIGLARNPVRFAGAGVIGVAQRASVERASRHGVFVRGRGGEVAAFLQKPDRAALREAGALGRDGCALVDLGLFSFDPDSIAALLEGAGVRLRAGKIAFLRSGLADRASRAELPSIDLYREVAMALPRKASRAQYLATCAGGARKDLLARPLGALLDSLRRTDFRVEVADVGDFLHIGSMREMLDALCGPKAEIARFGVEPGSLPLPALDVTSGVARSEPVVFDGRVARACVAKGRAIIDASVIADARLGGENIVCGVRADRLVLPEGVALFRLAVEPAARRSARAKIPAENVHIACGIDDDFKTRLEAGGTFFGRPFEAFLRSASLDASDVIAGDGTLWDARLWVVDGTGGAVGPEPYRALEWMWRGARAPDAWRRARRLSLGAIVAQGDGLPRMLARAMSVADLGESHPAIALAYAARDGSLASVHRSLLNRSIAARRAMLANEAALPVSMIASPLARAHALATMSCVAASLGRASVGRARELRAQAFAAVGEAVLSRIELPAQPTRAAILEDQAVWTSTPVRVDLAGGWTDTPPICNAVGGSVVNAAVTLRGQLPIQVVAKLDEVARGEEPVIRITSTDLGETRVVRTMRDLAARGDPTRWSSLAENA